jgi:hypothetical protein
MINSPGLALKLSVVDFLGMGHTGHFTRSKRTIGGKGNAQMATEIH